MDDWAFTVFLVDNSNDADGLFSDGYHAYAYLGGPFTVRPHLRPGGPPGPMLNSVFAHEMGHIFYATDEYDGMTEYSGYLMQPMLKAPAVSWTTLPQLYHLEPNFKSDGETQTMTKKPIVHDTNPETILNPYTTRSHLAILHQHILVQQQLFRTKTNNPHGPGNDVTIDFITD